MALPVSEMDKQREGTADTRKRKEEELKGGRGPRIRVSRCEGCNQSLGTEAMNANPGPGA